MNYEQAGQAIMEITNSHARAGLTLGDVTADRAKGAAKMLAEKAKIQKQLTEIQKKKTDSQVELEKLRGERAKVTLSNKNGKLDAEIGKINDQIGQLGYSLDGIPDIETILEKSLTDVSARIKAEARDETLNAQKVCAKQCLETSARLVKQLETAVATNNSLETLYQRYKDLAKETGIDAIGSHFAEPSVEMLSYVLGHMRAELTGKHCRVMMRGGCPQI